MPSLQDSLAAHIPALRRFAAALVRDREAADDLVQETLLRALKEERARHGGDLKPRLLAILVHLNRARRQNLARRAPHEVVVEDDRAAPPSAEPPDIVRALDALSDEQREALLLVALEGLDHAACAEALGVTSATVVSRLSRARATLRGRIDEGHPRRTAAPHLRVVK